MADENEAVDEGGEPAADIAVVTETQTAVVEGPAAETVDETTGEEKEKLDQQVLILDVGPCRKHIKVTVARADIDKLLDEKFKELMGDSSVPGFRPGKAPRPIVVRRFHKEVSNQIKSQILLASLEQLADEHDVAPLSPPNINPDKLFIPEKGPFVYEFEVEVRPQFDLPNYRGLKLLRPVRTFNEADVNRQLRRLLGQFGQLVPKDGPAELGDFIICDLTSRLGDRVIGAATELTLQVEDTVTFKDGVANQFAARTIGVKAGESRTVEIRMTDAVADESLKGQTAQATVEVKDVKAQRLPELTPAFLQTNMGVHTVEQLRERVRIMLDRRLEYAQKQSAREQVLQQLGVGSNWELPQDLLQRQSKRALGRRQMEMREAGMSEEEITSRSRLLERDVVTSTALALKEHFVLQKIAELEDFDLGDDEINAEIEAIADQNNESARRVRAQFEREDMMETLAAQLIERKALTLILDHAEYEDVPMEEEAGLSASSAQAIPGELRDSTAAPPESEKPEEAAESKEST